MEKKKKNVLIEGAISSDFIGNSIAKHASKHDIGAHSIFLGQVRADEKENGQVVAIEYECYEEMANDVFHTIREETFTKFDLTCMHIYHSLGRVNTGEICLFVFTSSKHRKEAIEACNYLVERIKKEAPVWGKEIIEDGKTEWKINN